jgi:hypothetical protein
LSGEVIMKTRLIALTLLVVSTAPGAAWSQRVVFDEVKARFNRSATDRRLIDKDADLVLDDEARRLTVRNDEHPLDVSYDDIEKVVFDVSTHMRGGALGRMVLGGLAGAAISGKGVSDYWCYLEYRGADGVVRPYMLEIAKDSSADAMRKLQALFDDKVVVVQFAEKAEEVEKDSLKDLQSKHEVNLDEKNHPMPETRTDKALVVIVCPPLAARDAGKGNQFKLHANDRVVAVNKMGSYTFVHLDPGEYLLVSQAGNASGMRMTLEAGKEYYFLQNTFVGTWKADTSLSRHSKELVMYESSGARFADWSRK